jgi:hypothetical protein
MLLERLSPGPTGAPGQCWPDPRRFAGLRPLGAAAPDVDSVKLSREHAIATARRQARASTQTLWELC